MVGVCRDGSPAYSVPPTGEKTLALDLLDEAIDLLRTAPDVARIKLHALRVVLEDM